MNILISCYVLDLSGTPTYTLTLYNELVRQGHKVTVYSPESGKLAEKMNVVTTLDGLEEPDIINAQMNTTVLPLRQAFPNVPIVFSSHGVLPPTEQKPETEVDWYTAINEDVVSNLVSQGVDIRRITIVRDFIDMERYRPTSPLNAEIKRILYISNRKKWKVYAIVTKACRNLGIEMKAVGVPYGRCYSVEEEINKADLVVTLGRGILESMACGRTAIAFGQGATRPTIIRGDGYLTMDVYFESRLRNFNGANCRYSFNADSFIEEIKKYDPKDGRMNRILIDEYHNVSKGVDKLLEVFRSLKRSNNA